MINFLNLTEYLLIKKSSFEKNLFHDDAADDIQIWESTFLSLSTFLCPQDSPIILSLSLTFSFSLKCTQAFAVNFLFGELH